MRLYVYNLKKKKKMINSALHLVWRLVFRNCSLFVNCCFDYTEFLIPSGKDLRHLTCISALRAGEARVVNLRYLFTGKRVATGAPSEC